MVLTHSFRAQSVSSIRSLVAASPSLSPAYEVPHVSSSLSSIFVRGLPSVRMRVILKGDYKTSHRGDVIEVKRGLGRNVLVKQNKALYATSENLAMMNEQISKENASDSSNKVVEEVTSVGSEINLSPSHPDNVPIAKFSLAPSKAASIEQERFFNGLITRLQNMPPLVFQRKVGNSQSRTGAPALDISEIYARLSAKFPSLSLNQLRFVTSLHTIPPNVPASSPNYTVALDDLRTALAPFAESTNSHLLTQFGQFKVKVLFPAINKSAYLSVKYSAYVPLSKNAANSIRATAASIAPPATSS